MPRKQRTNPEAEATVNPETATDNQSAEKSEAELANEQALKDAATAQSEQKEEVPAPQEDVIPDGACEVYGQADMNSKACKSCPVLDQCKLKTTAKVKPGKEKKEGGAGSRGPRVKTGEVSKFSQSDLGRQNGMIDKALETPHTLAELAAITGCSDSRIRSHVKWLKQNRAEVCHEIAKDGKIHFELK